VLPNIGTPGPTQHHSQILGRAGDDGREQVLRNAPLGSGTPGARCRDRGSSDECNGGGGVKVGWYNDQGGLDAP
jgi:hypothetical protein